MNPDQMFSPAGLRSYLLLETDGGGRYRSDKPSVPVHVAGQVVDIDRDALHCRDCQDPIDPPQDRPARYMALNKVLNDGRTRCLDCMTPDDETDDAAGHAVAD